MHCWAVPVDQASCFGARYVDIKSKKHLPKNHTLADQCHELGSNTTACVWGWLGSITNRVLLSFPDLLGNPELYTYQTYPVDYVGFISKEPRHYNTSVWTRDSIFDCYNQEPKGINLTIEFQNSYHHCLIYTTFLIFHFHRVLEKHT